MIKNIFSALIVLPSGNLSIIIDKLNTAKDINKQNTVQAKTQKTNLFTVRSDKSWIMK